MRKLNMARLSGFVCRQKWLFSCNACNLCIRLTLKCHAHLLHIDCIFFVTSLSSAKDTVCDLDLLSLPLITLKVARLPYVFNFSVHLITLTI